MSGSARAGTISREAYLRVMNPESLQCALSRARHGNLRFSIDKDLHGCRQTAPYSPELEPDIVLTQPHASGVDETCTPLGDLWLTCMTQFRYSFFTP